MCISVVSTLLLTIFRTLSMCRDKIDMAKNWIKAAIARSQNQNTPNENDPDTRNDGGNNPDNVD